MDQISPDKGDQGTMPESQAEIPQGYHIEKDHSLTEKSLTPPAAVHSLGEVDGSRAPALLKVEEGSPEGDGPVEHSGKTTSLINALIWFVRDQWFLIVMAALVVFASQVQVPMSQEHVRRTVVNYLSVSTISFVNGATLSTRSLVENFKRWKLHAFVQIQCYLVASAAAFAIVSLCATNPRFMDPWLLIGFLFVGCAPTTIGSNTIMTRQARGNIALTLVQSNIGQILCPFLTPILLQMYLSSGAWYSKVLVNGGSYAEIYRRVFKQLGLSLFVPTICGQILLNVFPEQTKKVFVDWKMLKLSPIALLLLIWQTFDQAFGSGAFASLKASNIVFTVCMCIGLHLVWLAISFVAASAWLSRQDVIACCYCCPAKALTMIVPLSSVMYIDLTTTHQSKIQIPAIIFLTFQIGIGGLFTLVFRRWVRHVEEQEGQEQKYPTQ